MAQTIKLKRSATAGAAPTTSQLELGEVAINTYDGKMYIKKSVGGTESIVEISGGGGASAADAILEEYLYTATNNQTAFSGNDDNSSFLSYVSGAIQVFLNGVLLDPETDYTATNGAIVTLTSGATTNDYLQIIAFKKKIGDSSITINSFTGNNSTTAFTLSLDPGDENNTRVFIDGVYQSKSNYTVSGTTLTFSSAPPSGTGIEVEIGNRAVSLDTASNLDLPDNVKLRLGTGLDLQIYHDGSNSLINDNGTGSLKVQTGGSTKLEVTSTGVDVTGNIAVSGTVDGVDIAARNAVLTSTTATAGAALPRTGGAMSGAITTNSTFDGRDVATDGSKLDGIESGATADQTQSEINALGITATGLSGTPAISVANITTTGELRGPASFVVDPAAVGDNTGTVIIKGNLQVDGATTTINSTTLTVDDLNLTLASGAANGTAANGAGITVDGASANITYASSTDSWDFNKKVKFNTVQAHGSNNFLIDSPAEIHLDSHSGFIRLRSQGGDIGLLQLSNNDITIRSMVSDKDILFQGYDGSTNITALILDMSNAGFATFNSGIQATSGDFRNTSSGAETTALTLRNYAAGANTATALNFYPTQSTTRFASIVAENIDGNNNIALSFLTAAGDTPSAAMTIDQNRNVGIGETNPSVSRLHVRDNKGSAGDVWTQVGPGNNMGITLQNETTADNANSVIYFKNDTDYVASIGARYVSHSTNETELRFGTTNSSGTSREKMYLRGGGELQTLAPVMVGGSVGLAASQISGTPADQNYTEVGKGYINLARDDTADAAQIRFAKNGSIHSYLETRTNGLGFVTGVGNFGFEGGNVGIGTPSPLAKLHVQSTGSDGVIVRTTTNAEPFIALQRNSGSNGVAVLRSIDGGDLRIDTGATGAAQVTKMTVEAGGNVGIGTIDPAAKLHISGNSDVSDEDCMLIIDDVDSSAGSRIPAIMFRSNTGGSVTNQARIRGTDTHGIVMSGSSALGDDLVVQSGKVGIGTTAPTTTLQINPSSGGYNLFFDRGNSTPGGANPWLGLFNAATVSASTYGWGFYDSNSDGSLQIWNRNNSTTGANALTIKRGGNVGIGTASPDSLLHLKSTGDTRMTIESPDANDAYINFSGATNEMSLGFDKSDAAMYITNHGTITANRRVTIKTDGKVGIGTDSPAVPLHVYNASQGRVAIENASRRFDLAVDADGLGFRDQSAAVTRMILTSAGRLHLGDLTASNAQFRVKQVSSGEWAANIIHNTGTAYGLSVDTSSSSANSTYNFAAYTPAGTGFFVRNSGCVGIGTTAPVIELDIKRHTNSYPLRIGSERGQGRAIVLADVHSSPTKYNWIVGSQYNIDNAFEITPSTSIGGYTFSNPAILVKENGRVAINYGLGGGAVNSEFNVFADGEALRLDGTANTSRTLRFRNVGVNGSSNGIIASDGSLQLKNEDANAAMYFNSIRDMEFQVTSGNGTAGNMTFLSYNTEIMRLDGANSRVGIGTGSTVGAKLHVKGAGGSTGLTFKTTDASNNETFFILDGGHAGTRYYPFTVGTPSSTTHSGTAFEVKAGSVSFPQLHVKQNGKVGIGWNAPTAALSVLDSDNTTTNQGLGGVRVHRPNDANQYGYIDYNYGGGGLLIGSNYTGYGASSTRAGEIYFYQHNTSAQAAPIRLASYIDSYGHFLPGADASYDLGGNAKRWRNVYTTDLHLSNESKEGGNDVDGTTGNWTVQEGAENLYLINNKTGKKYKFALEEIE